MKNQKLDQLYNLTKSMRFVLKIYTLTIIHINSCYIFQLLIINVFCWRPILHQSKVDKSLQITVAGQSYVDTEAGFLLNEDDLSEKKNPVWKTMELRLIYNL